MESHEVATPTRNQLARRDFTGASLAVGNSATDALVAKSRADTEARWIMAMRRPRNLDDVRQAILDECRRPGFAEVAVYEVPRGDTKITGLSIRFAEVAVRHMGNVATEVVTIYDDRESRIVRVTVVDFETNATWSKDLSIRKTVERKYLKKGQAALSERINSSGDRVFEVEATDDDTNTKEAAQVSKAARTLILRLIPGHIQDEAMKVCNAVYADKAAKDPNAERIKMLDAFASQGVRPSDLEELIGHSTERLTPAELERLRKVYAAVASGEVTWIEVIAEFRASTPPPPTTSQAAAVPPSAPAPTETVPPPDKAPRKPRGAAALKANLEASKPPEGNPDSSFGQAAADARAREQARTADPREAEPGWMAGETRGATPEGGKPVAPPAPEAPPPRDGYEDRACARCQVTIEVPTNDPPGAICYACSQS